MIGFLWSLYSFIYNISLAWWEIKAKPQISSTANQKKIKSSRGEYVMERALNFDQWKTKTIFWKL